MSFSGRTPSRHPPHALVACASFKGTLSSRLAGQAIARGLERAGISASVIRLADGGEGLVEALVSQLPETRYIETPVRGPRQEIINATFGLMEQAGQTTAIIEMAASSGLTLVPEPARDPKWTTTLGVGDQIRAALNVPNADVTRILVGIGGSATNDGGAGLAQALGANLLDAAGHELPAGGAALARLASIDISGLDKRLDKVQFIVACDVDNVLCGPTGASFIYGPQKGASAEDVVFLDSALAHYADVIQRDIGKNVRNVPGAGAAGGLGAGLLAFCNAKLVSGIDLLLDAVCFDNQLQSVDFVVTGEGFLDGQTLRGKAPFGVARRASYQDVACVAIGGDVEMDSLDELRPFFQHIESLRAFAGSLEKAKNQAAELLEELAYQKAEEFLKC